MDDRLLMKGKAIVMFLHKWSLGGGGGGWVGGEQPKCLFDFGFHVSLYYLA